jgi:hypothetical protein
MLLLPRSVQTANLHSLPNRANRHAMFKLNESTITHRGSRLMTLLVLQTACNNPRCIQEQSTSGIRDTGSSSAPHTSTQVEAPIPTAVTSVAGTVQPSPPACTVRVQPVKFVECRPPRHDDLECWFYTIRRANEPNEDDNECLPRSILIDFSGGQANANVLRANVDYDNTTRPHRATLTLDRVESTLTSFDVKSGTQLGTLIFENGHVSELRFGPGLPSQTGLRSIRSEPED